MTQLDQTTKCLLPEPEPAVCPACGATGMDQCMIDRPNFDLAEMATENARLRSFVQFVADCSNDPRVVEEALKMGAKI